MMNPDTPFTNNGEPIGLTIEQFWQYQYSSIYDKQEYIAEFLVGMALGLKEPTNNDYWTLWDITYKNGDKECRIEVKETSFYHSFQEVLKKGQTSEERNFDIHRAHVEYQNSQSEMDRNCDIYVFCFNDGKTRETSYPLDVNNWKFYIVTTESLEHWLIETNRNINQKSLSLACAKKLSAKEYSYSEIRDAVDSLLPSISTLRADKKY